MIIYFSIIINLLFAKRLLKYADAKTAWLPFHGLEMYLNAGYTKLRSHLISMKMDTYFDTIVVLDG